MISKSMKVSSIHMCNTSSVYYIFKRFSHNDIDQEALIPMC